MEIDGKAGALKALDTFEESCFQDPDEFADGELHGHREASRIIFRALTGREIPGYDIGARKVLRNEIEAAPTSDAILPKGTSHETD